MIKKKAQAAGGDWSEMPETGSLVRHRGVMIHVVGNEGEGKTSLSLTAANMGPLAHIDIDQSIDRAHRPEGKAGKGIRIHHVQYVAGLGEESNKTNVGPVYTGIRTKIEDAASNWASAVVIDTDTELWEVARLASFGTLTPKGRRMDRVYGPVNATLRNMLRGVYRKHGKHLIVISHLVDEYLDKIKDGEMSSVRTGKRIPKGFKEIGWLADMRVRAFRKKGKFMAELEMCKLSPNGPLLEGSIYEDEEWDLAHIIAQCTETDRDDWVK